MYVCIIQTYIHTNICMYTYNSYSATRNPKGRYATRKNVIKTDVQKVNVAAADATGLL